VVKIDFRSRAITAIPRDRGDLLLRSLRSSVFQRFPSASPCLRSELSRSDHPICFTTLLSSITSIHSGHSGQLCTQHTMICPGTRKNGAHRGPGVALLRIMLMLQEIAAGIFKLNSYPLPLAQGCDICLRIVLVYQWTTRF
jgi:hypothetical protein